MTQKSYTQVFTQKKNIFTKKNNYNIFIYNSQKLEIAQVSINRRLEIQTVV